MSHDKKLMDAIRQKAFNKRNHAGLYLPRTAGDVETNWPTCGTCRRDVEAVELKNANSTSVELWARCHGKEDWYKILFPYHVSGDFNKDEGAMDQVRMAMRTFTPFVSSITL